MPMLKKSEKFVEGQKAAKELEQHDIYTMNDATAKRLRKTEKNGEYTIIDDVDAFFDQFKK